MCEIVIKVSKDLGSFHEKLQRTQQQIGGINEVCDKIELSIAAITALVEKMMKRLPVVKQPTMVQPEPKREAQSGQSGGAPIVSNQPSILEPIETIPRRVETRNVILMRAPNHEVHFNLNQPQFSMPYDDPFEPRPKRLNGSVFLNPIVESLCGLGNARPPPSFKGQCGLYDEEYWREKRFLRQQQ